MNFEHFYTSLFILIILFLLYQSKSETFANIKQDKVQKELDYLSDRYDKFDYKNYDFAKIQDKEGDFKNNPFTSVTRNTFSYTFDNNQFFKPLQLFKKTSTADIFDANANSLSYLKTYPEQRNKIIPGETLDKYFNVTANIESKETKALKHFYQTTKV